MLNRKNQQKNLRRTEGAANSKIVGPSSWTISDYTGQQYPANIAAGCFWTSKQLPTTFDRCSLTKIMLFFTHRIQRLEAGKLRSYS